MKIVIVDLAGHFAVIRPEVAAHGRAGVGGGASSSKTLQNRYRCKTFSNLCLGRRYAQASMKNNVFLVHLLASMGVDLTVKAFNGLS